MRYLALCLLVPRLLAGQVLPDAADSARVAGRRANEAFSRGDLNTARTELQYAARVWPQQPAYVWSSAVVSALLHDTAGVRSALTTYARFDLGKDLTKDSRFAEFSTAMPALFKKLNTNFEPLDNSRIVRTWSDSTLYPEGIDYDAKTQTYFVASVRHGTLMRVTKFGVFDMHVNALRGIGAVLGVRVDRKHDALWITTSGIPQREGYAPADSSIAALLRFKLDDWSFVGRWDLPARPGGRVLGDLAVAPNGDVFVTDSRQPMLYWLHGDSIETLASRLFHSLQGAAVTPDNKTLYLADYSHGLLHFDLATRKITPIEGPPGSTSVGCDGIGLYKHSVVCVQNGVAPPRIMQFFLDKTGMNITEARVVDQHYDVADEPTVGTVVGNEFVYVATSQWEKYDDDGKRKPGVALTKPVLLGAPLR